MKPRKYRIIQTNKGFYPQYRAWYGWRSIASESRDIRFVQEDYFMATQMIKADHESRNPDPERVIKITEVQVS